MALPFLTAWRAARGREERARRYVRTLMNEPTDAEVADLAAATDHDEDHARWELRYARRALGVLVAERDALDDRTSSDVVAALDLAHRADSRIAADRRAVSQQQLNERLHAYRVAMSDRAGGDTPAVRVGRVLVTFARGTARPELLTLASNIAEGITVECNAALRAIYGEASLPENLKPSEIG